MELCKPKKPFPLQVAFGHVIYHSQRKQTMAETGAKDGLIDVTVLITLFWIGLRKGLEFGLENLLCPQSYYNGLFLWTLGRQERVERNADGGGLACDVSDISLRVP